MADHFYPYLDGITDNHQLIEIICQGLDYGHPLHFTSGETPG